MDKGQNVVFRALLIGSIASLTVIMLIEMGAEGWLIGLAILVAILIIADPAIRLSRN